MTTFGKIFLAAFFVTLFLFTSIWDYFKNNNMDLFENSFYSLCVTTFLFIALLLRNNKNEVEK